MHTSHRVMLDRQRWLAGAAAFIAVVAVRPGLAAAGGAEALQPHRAVYDMQLVRSRADGDVAGVSGLFSVEIEETCEGWGLNQRMRMVVTRKQDGEFDSDQRFASFETRDGLSYVFQAEQKRDGVVTESFAGNATLDAHDRSGTAAYREPPGAKAELPPNTLFPVGYNNRLMDQIAAGARVWSSYSFHGADMDSVFEVNAVIGGEAAYPTDGVEGDTDLLQGKARSVQIAYFGAYSPSPEPVYEVALKLLPNGVSPYVEFDYGFMTLAASLRRVEALPKPSC